MNYSMRAIAHSLNTSWATLARYFDRATQLCQLVGESTEPHFSQSNTKGKGDIRLSQFGATCLLVAMPGRIPGVTQMQAELLGALANQSLPQPGDRSGFVLALQNTRGLVRFSVSRTPMAPMSKIKPLSPFECQVQSCTWADDAPRLAAQLSDDYREYSHVGDWFNIPDVELMRLPALAGGLSGMVVSVAAEESA